MNGELVVLLRVGAFVSMIGYFVFSFFDSRRIKDEREELIQLKSLEIVHKATLGTITFLAVLYAFWHDMPALLPIFAVVLSSMYAEIAAKLYLRHRY